jgi:hypothetical protein
VLVGDVVEVVVGAFFTVDDVDDNVVVVVIFVVVEAMVEAAGSFSSPLPVHPLNKSIAIRGNAKKRNISDM